jgi:hypothetical protein
MFCPKCCIDTSYIRSAGISRGFISTMHLRTGSASVRVDIEAPTIKRRYADGSKWWDLDGTSRALSPSYEEVTFKRLLGANGGGHEVIGIGQDGTVTLRVPTKGTYRKVLFDILTLDEEEYTARLDAEWVMTAGIHVTSLDMDRITFSGSGSAYWQVLSHEWNGDPPPPGSQGIDMYSDPDDPQATVSASGDEALIVSGYIRGRARSKL